MAKEKNPEPEKKTRVVLTGAEKIAKMEAELAAAREKEQAKAQAKIAGAEDKVAALTKRRDEVQAKLNAAVAELEQLKRDAGVDEQPELPTS